jgi:hypothetical protein
MCRVMSVCETGGAGSHGGTANTCGTALGCRQVSNWRAGTSATRRRVPRHGTQEATLLYHEARNVPTNAGS